MDVTSNHGDPVLSGEGGNPYVILEVLLPDQAPVGRKSRAKYSAHENVIVHIPNRCLSSDRIVKKVIRVSVTVKVGCSDQGPAIGNVRPISASDERWS